MIGGCLAKSANFVEVRSAGEPVKMAAHPNEQGACERSFLDINGDMVLLVIESFQHLI